MAQQETYGNWLGPKRLVRQPGIYSVAGRVSPLSDFRPASPDSFEDDYDDVSVAGSEPGPAAKGVYLLAGPVGSSRAPTPKDPNSPGLDPKIRDLDPKLRDLDPKLGDSDPKFRDLDPKVGDLAPEFRGSAPKPRRAPVLALLALLAVGAVAGAALLGLVLGRQQELRAELELLRWNLSGIWDSLQQEQTRLQFGIHQHQQELQEINALLCGSPGGSRRCPAGWKSWGSSCFSFSREPLGWAGARDACADLGAHLAVVSSEEEQVFLVENSERNGSYWLGLRERRGRAVWVTGEEPGVGFWDVWGAEAGPERGECGALGPKGRWLRRSCARRLGWICERPGAC